MAKCKTCANEAHADYEYCLECVDFLWSETGGNTGPSRKVIQAPVEADLATGCKGCHFCMEGKCILPECIP